MSDQLLPCPFCGSSASTPRTVPDVGMGWGQCDGCGVETHDVEAWNRRNVDAIIGSLPALNGDELERLAAAVDARAKRAALDWADSLHGVRFGVEQ